MNTIVRLRVRDDENHADLSDILIAESSRVPGCEGGIAFDRGAARLPFFTLLK